MKNHFVIITICLVFTVICVFFLLWIDRNFPNLVFNINAVPAEYRPMVDR